MLHGLMVGMCNTTNRLLANTSKATVNYRLALRPLPSLILKSNILAGTALALLLMLVSSASHAADPKEKSNFVKIANDGSVLPNTAAQGSGAKDWACTRDTETGLIWEVKTASGLRGQSNTYTWFKSGNLSKRSVGTPSGGNCASSGRCDTEKYVADVNSAGLCGASDWRLPQTKELEGLVANSLASPTVNPTYFPNTPSTYYWTGTPGAYYSSSAWAVYVSDGQSYYFHRTGSIGVRLVRTSPQ